MTLLDHPNGEVALLQYYQHDHGVGEEEEEEEQGEEEDDYSQGLSTAAPHQMRRNSSGGSSTTITASHQPSYTKTPKLNVTESLEEIWGEEDGGGGGSGSTRRWSPLNPNVYEWSTEDVVLWLLQFESLRSKSYIADMKRHKVGGSL